MTTAVRTDSEEMLLLDASRRVPNQVQGSGVSTPVTAVIPTRNRPGLVVRAVLSALAQDHAPLEVIVVVDGPDPETVAKLHGIADPRLKIISLDASVGGAEARNVGVREAQGEWIALLDDDDEWLPSKIRKQLEVAALSASKFPIVSCRMHARSPLGEFTWPRRLPGAGEPVSEYVLARRGLFQGEGTVTTTTLLVRKQLLLEVPFSASQQRHQEWDWLFRALNEPETQLVFAPEPLSVWHIDEARPTMSGKDDWRYSYDWIERIRPIVTRRAYAAFLLTLVTSLAARAGEWRAYPQLLRAAVKNGRPAPIDFLLFSGMVAVPQRVRRRLRALFSK
jgi:glycosyltransferase involved in cell wall biosynthesis